MAEAITPRAQGAPSPLGLATSCSRFNMGSCGGRQPPFSKSAHELVNEQDYDDRAQNQAPIGNLKARYRCISTEPFHGFPSEPGRLKLATDSRSPRPPSTQPGGYSQPRVQIAASHNGRLARAPTSRSPRPSFGNGQGLRLAGKL